MISIKRPAVFLDRDGTLNRQVVREGKPYPPHTVDEFTVFEDVPMGCKKLKQAGYLLVVATNQPDVGRGTQSEAAVTAMHLKLMSIVHTLDRIEVCFAPGQGIPSDQNYRRKPAPGMIHDAATALNIDLARSWMIGDRWRDINCGKRAGLRTIFIDFGYAEKLREKPDFVVKTFAEATDLIIQDDHRIYFHRTSSSFHKQ
jgi:D-glycero-D-manno-heptose 1,7-bisphosphate phosphatase